MSSARRARGAWALFDWAAQPYYTLITTFIFAPYFVAVLVGDGVRGQALWGYLQAGVGICLALSAPLLGAWLDRTQNPRPVIAIAGFAHICGCAMLWWAVPGAPGLVVAFFGVGLAALGVEYATIATNILLPRLAQPGAMGKLSGSAWALGYVGGLASLALVMVFLAPAPGGEKTIAGLAPLFGLTLSDGGPARATGVFSALWFAIFVVPLLVFVPMKKPTPGPTAETNSLERFQQKRAPLLRSKEDKNKDLEPGFGSLKTEKALVAMWHLVRDDAVLRMFLIARIFYQDGLIAIFAFGGIYGAALFGWSTFELGLFGILLSVTAGLGAWAGGRLDDKFGPLPVVAGAILFCLGAILAILTIEPAPASATGLFSTAGERAYLAASTLIGLGAGPLQAASRTFLARLAPREKIGVYFGLLAFSGKATAFIGPLLVALVTSLAGSQRAGLVPIAVLFLVGLLGLAHVARISNRRASSD
ncbi:MAG: MFS transporter [Alphaproteobacteria bacterium]